MVEPTEPLVSLKRSYQLYSRRNPLPVLSTGALMSPVVLARPVLSNTAPVRFGNFADYSMLVS
jgi:hypothetical protein